MFSVVSGSVSFVELRSFGRNSFAMSIMRGKSLVCDFPMSKSMLSSMPSVEPFWLMRHGIHVPSGISRTVPFR